MRTHRPWTTALALLVALVLGVAAGSTGTATAAGLTKKTVKKIAAQVVAKQAPSLTVARAARADQAASASTAANVQGFSAASLTTTPTVFTIAPGGGPYNQVALWTLPQAAPGAYTFDYSAAIVPPNGTTAACGFVNPDTLNGVFGATSVTFSTSLVAALVSGTATHTVAAGDKVAFFCQIPSGSFSVGSFGISISQTLLNGSTAGAPLTVTTPIPRPGRPLAVR